MDSFYGSKRHIHGALLLIVAGLTAPLTNLLAANPENVAAEVTFVDPITITENNALQFGLVSTALANLETISVGTDGATTDVSGRLVNTSQAASDLTVGATAATALTVVVDTIVNGQGYALGAFLCDYNAGASAGACDGAGLSVATSIASATLLIGATITGDGLDVAGAANGSFNVTVSYQ